MIIDRSKHNKFVANSTYTDLINRTQSSGKDSTTSSTSGNIIYVGGGGGSGNIDSDLIEELRNQEAFSYLNVSDGTNTKKVEAKIEKDYINLNFVGDSESTETKVSSGRYLPETYFEATGTKSGNYNLSYEQISVPEIVDEKPVKIIKWRIVLKKVFGNPIFPGTDFTGVKLLKEDISLGVYDLDDKRVTVSSNDTTGLSQIIILQDKDLDFDKLQLVKQVGAKNEVVTTISNISIQTYITVLITQAGAARFWKLDEHNKLYTDYDAYSNKTLGAKDMIWSNKGYKVGNFVQGISGGVFYISDKLGTTYIEADKLRVRKKAYFETLEIVNVNTVGGKQIISPGGAVTIRKVEEFDDYYRCYFLGKQDDVVVENRFRVNDLAFSQNFNIKEPGEYEQVANHYFWRLVVGVSTNVDANDNHYIDLSKTDCDLNSDIPHVNDVIAQLGNRTDTNRQSALIFSSVDVESPRIILCSGISTYTLTATDRFDLGVNHTNNQAYMNVYGNAYIGAKDQSSYMSYSVENGLSIKGNLDISSTIGDKSFSDVFVTSENFEETVNAVIGDELEYLQNQIDGNIESYFYDYSPTLENYPASEWTDEQTKTRHIGDTFTNIQEYVDDETTPDAGKSWRWVKSAEGVWGWTPIADSDAVLALKKAGQAQDTADGKRRVFVQQPTDMDVYDVGDLWVNATYSDSNITYTDDLLRAKTSKAKGHPFNIKHWTLASNYKNLAEDAIAAAEEAGEAANNAQQSINNYKNEINSVFQDGIITTSEASRLRTLVDTINTTLVDAQKTYEEVYNNGALDNKSQKTELASAFSAFDTAADNLIQIVTEIVNKATTQSYTITKADISNVDNAYSIFNTKYADYIIALNAANLEIMNTLSNNAYANAVNEFGWLNGLFDPDQKTTIEGAVVTTGVLALGKTIDGVFTVNAGINGVENNSYLGNGIAIWFGGDMIDKDNYSAGQRPENTASSLFRFDGSGYLGYKPNSDASRDDAPIWWDTQGNLHANPLSFFVGETTVGFLLSAFQPVDSNEDGDADYLIQHIPFQTLQIGSAYLGYDAVNKAVYVYTLEDDGSTNVCNFYATGEVTAYGSGDGSSMPTVINYLYELRDVNWGIGTKPSNADTMIMWNGETWLYVNKNEVGLNEEQLEQYLTENGYAKKSDITNDVNAVSVTGSGNAVTSASVSGHTLTLTKGSTFLLSSAYTAADILTKLKTVDGSNSGLDADTVDGKHLTDILASNVASATKLQTARLIWGRSFDGTNDISGDIKNVGNIYGTGAIYINSLGNIALRYNNDDTKSIALTATSFKPFGTATNKIDLGNSTDRWRNLYVGSNADITGNTIIGGKLSVTGLITASAGLTTTNYIQIGKGRIYWDERNKALYVKSSDGTSAINFYSTGEVAAYGSNSESGGGSTSYDRLDDWNDYSEDKSGYVLSAGLGWDLNSRIKDIESNGILSINTTGSGNVVTNISKSGTVITVTKGITALTSVNLATITDLHSTWDSVLKNAKPTTLSGYGIQASDVLNTIKTVDGHNSGLNADLLDGWHRSEFYTPFDGSKTYGGSFSAGAQDTGWKKLCDIIIPETGTYKGVIIDGNISYGRTNHAAAVFIKTPFQIVFTVDGTDTTRHRVYLYIPKYFTYDVIQVVKLDEYNYQVQIRQFSSHHTVYAFFQTKTYGGTRTVPYNKIETASDGEVIRNIANASVMVEDSAYTATKLQTPRKIWGRDFDGTKDISGDLKNVGNIYGTNTISLISNTGTISFKFNNDEASSIAFTRTEFRPYTNSNNKINLGSSDARWKDLYLGGNAHIDGNITATGLILPYSGGQWLSMATGSGVLRGASGNSSGDVAHALYRVKDEDGNVLAFGGYQSSLGFYGFLASDIETSNNKFTFYTAWNINTKILTHRGNLVVTEKVGIGSSTISEMLNINGNIKFLGTSFYLKDYHGNSVLKYTDGHFTLASNDSPIYIRTKGIDDNTNQVSISNTDGLVTLTSLYSKNYIQIGDGRIYWDAANKALYIKHKDGTSAINFYSTGEITAYGKSSQSGGGETNYDRLDSWEDYTSDKSGYVLSAGLGWDLNTRVNKLEQGSALTITTTGNGNAVTAITKNGTVITVTKDKTFLDATNYASTLDTRYVKKSGDTMSGSLTVYGRLRYRSALTNMGVSLASDNTAGYLQLGNVADSEQIQNGYITGYFGSNLNSLKIRTVNNSAVTINDNKVWNAGNDGHNSGLDADLLDGTHKTGLLTALSSSSTTNISLTVGGTTKTISDLYATTAEKLSTTSAGSATRPVYFANGIPVAGTYTFGNANGNAAINNGTLNANLNADKLDGYHYTAFPLRNTTNLYVNSTNPSIKILEFERSSEKGWLRLSISDSNNSSHGVTAKYIVSWSYDNSNENKSVTLRCLYYFAEDVSTKLTVSRISGNVFGLYYTPNSVASYFQYLIEGHSASCIIINYNSSTTATPTATYTSRLQQIGLIAAQATKLQTPRTLWGQSFDGTANVSGNLSGVGSIIFSNDGYIRNAETYIGFYTVDGKAKGIKAKTLYLGTTYANEPSYTLHVGGTLGVDSTARIGGALTSVGLITASAGLTTSQYIQIGDGRIYWDATNKALYVKHKDGSTAINFYATGEVTAYGSSSSSGGGGGTSYNRLDSWDDYESGKAGYVLSAGLGWDLNTRVKSLEGGSALTVTTTGRGNVITSISKSGTTITANKGITALTSVNIATISDLNSGWDSLLKAAPSIYVTRHPSISEVTNKQDLVIKLNNGTTEGTNLFTYNVTSAKTINITASSIGAAASSHNHSWSNITSGKPTTLSGYGITDAYTKNASDSRYVNVSGDTMTGMLKVSSGGIISTTSTNNGVRLTGDSRGGWVQLGTMDMDPTNKAGFISAYAGVDLTSLDVRIANNGFTINSNPILHTGNYTSTLDGRYVKKSGDIMTGPLKINGTTDQLIVIDSNRTPYIEFKLNGSRQAVFGGSNNVPSVYTNTWHKIWHAGNDGPESGLNADLLDDYHYNEFESYKKVVIDASALNENTWYPVTMLIGNSLQTRIRIEGNTSAEASWNSRSDKRMSLILDYTVNGSYWGWTNVSRVVYQYIEGEGTSSCLRGLGQLTNSSTEYVFVRGGAVYDFYVSRFIEPVLRSSTYTINGQSVSPTTTMPDAITINNALITSNVASATKLKNPRNIWGHSFDGTNDISGSMTSVTAINNNIYFNNSKTIVVTSVTTESQDSQWKSKSITICNNSIGLYGINLWNNGDGTGHIQVGRIDSVSTYYNLILQEYGGNIGIGTKSPSQKLHVSGNILATGEITAYSDKRLKSNIESLTYRGRLNPKSYIKDNKQSIGFIAQDVQELYPELVMETGGDNNYLSLNYSNITAVLSAQINTVEDEVTVLKRRVKELEDKLEVYESSITTSNGQRTIRTNISVVNTDKYESKRNR